MRNMILAAALLVSAPAYAEGTLFTKEVLIPADQVALRAPPPTDPRAMEADLNAFVMQSSNAQRARAGLPALARDPALARAAARYSRLMHDQNFFSHVSPSGERLEQRLPESDGWRYEKVGENLWSAQGAIDWQAPAIADETAANWIESPSHRDNLLEPAYTLGGVGTAIGGDKIYITMLYGRPHADPAQAALLRDHGEAPADLGGLSRSMKSTLVSAMNRERIALGLPALRPGASLSRIAQDHARSMLGSGRLAGDGVLHRAFAADGGSIRQLALGLWHGSGGLAWQPGAMTGKVIETWRTRPDTWADVVNPRFNLAGLGVATDGAQVYVAAIFAERPGGASHVPASGPTVTLR